MLDSIRPRIEIAVTRSDFVALDTMIVLLRRVAATSQDPWVQYELGYALHRRASAMMRAEQMKSAKPLLQEAERALARSQELGGGPSALALHGAVTGQLAGVSGGLAAMRLGPRAFRELDDAVAAAPRDPRVALLNGMSRLNAPRLFGGGPSKGEPELRRAVALFAEDRAVSPSPTWGHSDAWIWLGIALGQLDRPAEARAALQEALALAPGNVWVTNSLLPSLDGKR